MAPVRHGPPHRPCRREARFVQAGRDGSCLSARLAVRKVRTPWLRSAIRGIDSPFVRTRSGHFEDARTRAISFDTYAAHMLSLSSCRAQRGWIVQALYQVQCHCAHNGCIQCTSPTGVRTPLQRVAASRAVAQIFVLAKGNPAIVGTLRMLRARRWRKRCSTCELPRRPVGRGSHGRCHRPRAAWASTCSIKSTKLTATCLTRHTRLTKHESARQL